MGRCGGTGGAPTWQRPKISPIPIRADTGLSGPTAARLVPAPLARRSPRYGPRATAGPRRQRPAGGPGGSGAGGDSGTEDRGPRRWLSIFARPWLWVLVGLLVLNWLITPYLLPEPAQERITVPYTTFKEQVSAGNVSEITSRGDRIQGTFKQPVTYPPRGRTRAPPRGQPPQFETRVPTFARDDLEALLEQRRGADLRPARSSPGPPPGSPSCSPSARPCSSSAS